MDVLGGTLFGMPIVRASILSDAISWLLREAYTTLLQPLGSLRQYWLSPPSQSYSEGTPNGHATPTYLDSGIDPIVATRLPSRGSSGSRRTPKRWAHAGETGSVKSSCSACQPKHSPFLLLVKPLSVKQGLVPWETGSSLS